MAPMGLGNGESPKLNLASPLKPNGFLNTYWNSPGEVLLLWLKLYCLKINGQCLRLMRASLGVMGWPRQVSLGKHERN
jgi:hypothetical protein